MRRSKLGLELPLIIGLSLIICQSVFPQSQRAKDSKEPAARPVIWEHPGNISTRNLYHGPGSADMAPVGPFSFVEEDKGGESPKFVVRDARGDEWTVKLGPEAQAETCPPDWCGQSILC